MERLTTRNIAGVAVLKQSYDCERCGEAIYRLPDLGNRSPIDKLAEYEEAEEQGLLLRLPYNIATCGVVYYVDEKDREIYRLQADKIEIYKMMISNKFVYTIDCFDFFYEDFGKIVFTNKEEAEAALQAMQEGE